jgi:pimeloyl-ACP methyl ester carboxylesterase
MRRARTGWVAILLILVAAGQSAVTTGGQGKAGEEAIGEWVGEISLPNNWQLVELHIQDSQNQVKGTLDITLEGATGIELKGLHWDAADVRFAAATPEGDLAFSGRLGDGELQGSVRGTKSANLEGTFHLAHLATVNSKDYTGGYEATDGTLITLSAWPDQGYDLARLIVQYSDTHTGRFGSLFPLSPTRFVSGGPLARVFPIEVEATFERNQRGEVTGLIWREGSGPEIHGKKTSPYHEEEIKFNNRKVTLAGTLVVPLGKGPHPAVVFTHGSGAQIRQRGVLEQLFVRAGVAVLTYDKRGVGESTGDWNTASFEDLADDAVAGAEFLRSRSDIDPKRIGFWGLSQGGWIAPLAADRFGKPAFVMGASGGGLSPDRQELLNTESSLSDANFSNVEIAQAMDFQMAKNAFMRTGKGWAAYQTLQQKDKDMRWYGFVHTDAWGPESKDDTYWKLTASFYFYDPAPTIQSLHCPVLFVFGELDAPKGVQEDLTNLKAWAEKAGNQNFAIKVFPGAGHNLFVGESDYVATIIRDRLRYTPGYLDFMRDWIVLHAGVSK